MKQTFPALSAGIYPVAVLTTWAGSISYRAESDLTPQKGKELAPQSWLKLFRRTSLFGEIFKGNIYTPKAHWFYVRFEQWNTFDTFEHLYLSNQATSVELMIREPEHLIIFNASILAALMLFYRWKLESQKVIWPISCIYIYIFSQI